MENLFDKVFYEPDIVNYELGKQLLNRFKGLEWIEIESHNRIPSLSSCENRQFAQLKQHLIIGTRKTHKYVPNQKVSDWLVPYTSSGCRAMCLYCYLVCNYNKCSYLRLFVNREQMMDKLIKTSLNADKEQTFEIGSNSDLILENTITHNLEWTIENFAQKGRGHITLPTKFDMVDSLLNLNHQRKTIFRMSVNPSEIIKRVEIGTSSLEKRIDAINKMCEADYPVGILIAPVILTDNWKKIYSELIETLSQKLSNKVKKTGFIEVILMTYSYVHNAINTEAFPNAYPIFNKETMTGKGRGKYSYKPEIREDAVVFLKDQLNRNLGSMPIIYFS